MRQRESVSVSKESSSLRTPRIVTAKITDFGLAKRLDDVSQTASGAVMGTPSYMAPEQAHGDTHAIGPSVDIYALGAVLYEMLTGRPPFKAATVLDTLWQVMHQEPVPPTQAASPPAARFGNDLPEMSAKRRSQRYATATELADDLHRFLLNEPIGARPVGRLERGWRWLNPAVASLLATAAASLLLGTGVAWSFALKAQTSEGLALKAQARWDTSQDQAEATCIAPINKRPRPTSNGCAPSGNSTWHGGISSRPSCNGWGPSTSTIPCAAWSYFMTRRRARTTCATWPGDSSTACADANSRCFENQRPASRSWRFSRRVTCSRSTALSASCRFGN